MTKSLRGHSPLLNRRCTRLPGCIRLRNDLYCVGWGVKLYTHSRREHYRKFGERTIEEMGLQTL